jgi:alpha-L-arabinofuranosidase
MVGKHTYSRIGRTPARRLLRIESLEDRSLLTVLSVNASDILRPVSAYILGTNVNWYTDNLNTAQTKDMVQASGMALFRLPGGSSSDEFHFDRAPWYSGQGTAASMASFVASVGGGGMVTLDYGSGSPQEAAAFLAYLNGSPTNATAIGTGAQWSTTSNTWVQKDWKTVGYWAGLRAAAPLPQDDGLNFLRLGRAAPFDFHYFEIGNEVYGSWETDHHGQGGDTGKAHDPATYIAFAKQFAALAAGIDSSISIGVLDDGGVQAGGWTMNVLTQCVAQGFTPGFLSDHSYPGDHGTGSDSSLLHIAALTPDSGDASYNYVQRASDYRSLLQQVLGTAGNNVKLLLTEFNSSANVPSKQTVSLVNGLFLADALGSLLQSGYEGATFWDLRNGWETDGNLSSSLYGWRKGGDEGMLGTDNGKPPSTGSYVAYPTYFAEQLLSKMAHTGDSVVQAGSDNANLTVYAVREANGHLDLLVVNKDPTNALTSQIQLVGFAPTAQAQVWQYGKAEDTAQSHTTDGHSALTNFTTTLALSGAGFNYSFPSYSMTVIDVGPSDVIPPTVSITAVTPNPRVRSVDSITVRFSETVVGFGLEDLRMTLGGASVPLTGATLTSSDRQTWTLGNLSATTAPVGAYQLALVVAGSGITDLAGNALAAGANMAWRNVTPIPGDFNLDGVVDNLDLSIWFRYAGVGTTLAQGDANGDGVVNGLDMDIWLANRGKSIYSGAPAAAAATRMAAREAVFSAMEFREFYGRRA